MMDTNTYKKNHPPKPLNEQKKGGPHQGVYVPTNKNKVIGGEIITRSSWEMSFARWCDDNPAVLEWGCETVAIQYRNPAGVNLDACHQANVSPQDPNNWPIHSYYPDFYIALRDDDDMDGTKVKKMMIEIKPFCQTERPIAPPVGAKLQEQKKFVNDAKTYLQNTKKWEAAILWCKAHGMEFRVFTEVTLQKMGIL